MVDVSSIAGALSALKGASDIAKAMIGLRDGQLVQSKIIELNSIIIDAQMSLLKANEERAALVERVRKLEQELTDRTKRDAEKDTYTLVSIGMSNVAFIKKAAVRGTEPPHYACANCYKQGKTVILSHMHMHGFGDILTCSACKAKTAIEGGYIPPENQTV